MAWAEGKVSFSPLRTTVRISSSSPKLPLGSARYFSSYLANIQWGVQPVTIIGFLSLYALSSAAAMAALEPSISVQSASS
ncbi:hypothetical protein D3C80_2130800 [compost metagenome]